jgi:hypothetical protein
MADMSEKIFSAISIILLLLGTILMLATGIGLTSSNDAIHAGAVCLVASVFVERILKKTKSILRRMLATRSKRTGAFSGGSKPLPKGVDKKQSHCAESPKLPLTGVLRS